MTRTGLLTLIGWLFIAGCADTEECKELRKVLNSSERALRAAQGRAQLADRTRENLKRIRAEVEKKLEKHGLDLDEDALLAKLEARAGSMKGVSVERSSRPMAPDPRDPSQRPQSEMVIRFTFKARDLASAWEITQALSREPPLTRLFTLLAPKRRRDPWRLELGPVDVQKVPTEGLKPRPLPPRKSSTEVSEEFGFCGASALREQIAKVDAETDGFAEKAGETTVNLPLFASWKGLSRRADLALDTEAESRRLAEALIQASLSAEVPFIGLALEKEAVLLEIKGGKWEKSKAQSKLPPQLLSRLRELSGGREGVARLALGNAVSAAARRPNPGGESEPHGTSHSPSP